MSTKILLYKFITIYGIITIMTLISAGIVSADDTCNVCTENCTPCGGGCTATDMTMMFAGASNWSAIGNISGWNTSCVTNMNYMFYNSNFNQDISSWNTSRVTNMNGMFGYSKFNQDISMWDTSNVTDMGYMFQDDIYFNQPIDNWDIRNVNNIYYMLAGATSFNQPLNNWDTSSITNMNGMFNGATSFNQNLSNWNTSRVTLMNYMFYNAGKFNQDIGMWDVTSVVQMYNMLYDDTLSTHNYDSLLNGWSTENIQSEVTFSGGHSKYSSTGETGHDILTGNPYYWDINDGGLEMKCDICNETCSPCGGGCTATDLSGMFQGMTNFDSVVGNISGWNTSCITSMASLFYQSDFNQNINSWDVSKVVSTDSMFAMDSNFNQLLNLWNTTSVNNMHNMFANTPFNQDISGWNTASVSDMSLMFEASPFNQDISGWNTSSVTNMQYMFNDDTSFDQDISSWNIGSVNNMVGMFHDVTLSTVNYDSLLNGWVNNPRQSDIYFDAGNSIYSLSSKTSHDTLTDSNSWHISDGGLNQINCDVCNETCSPCGGGCTATDLSSMFAFVNNFDETIGNISRWNTSCITNMSTMFENSDFNQNIGAWDTSKVIDMSYMFRGATSFNQNLSTWNTSSVTEMIYMFSLAYSFNGDISGWDTHAVTAMNNMFNGASSFNQPIDMWDTSSVNNMYAMFSDATVFDQDISSWNTSSVTDIRYMFAGARDFNQPIGSWDVSQVTSMTALFAQGIDNRNTVFDQDLGSWNVSMVTDMTNIFQTINFSTANYDSLLLGWSKLTLYRDINFDAGNSKYSSLGMIGRNILTGNFNWHITDGGQMTCSICSESCSPCGGGCNATDLSGMFQGINNFDSTVGNISGWNTSCIVSMDGMFQDSSNFDQDINSWDVSSVTDMNNMFSNAADFNKNISSWNTSNVIEMTGMFDGASSFDQDLSSWNTSKVTSMRYMFNNAISFNHPIDSWNVSSVTSMEGMFNGASSFNQNLSSWNTSSVTDMAYMFDSASAFNGDISTWNISNVTDVSSMFYNTESFNQPLNLWDASRVTNMAYMFQGAYAFDQDISLWNITNVLAMDDMFTGITLSTSNYDSLLNKWSNQTVQNQVPFSGGNSIYSNAGKVGRNILLNDYNWTITDGGQASCDICSENCSPCGGGCTATDMSMMYAGVTNWSSIGDITGWNTSCITSMDGMFYNSNFNQPIGNWNTSAVADMDSTFSETQFNQPLDKWDTSSVLDFSYMFDGDNFFDQNVSSWNISNAEYVEEMFNGDALSINNYDALLNSWSNQISSRNTSDKSSSKLYGALFDGGNSLYSSNGLAGRDILTNTFNWTITDGGYYTIAEVVPSPVHGLSGGSNGGSGSGGIICSEKWKCDAWSACSKYGLRIRTCNDISSCGTTVNKPSISEVCNIKEYNTTVQNPKKALFDILTEIVTEPRKIGDDLVVKVSLINFGLKGTVNAHLNYKILDNESQIVKQFEETIPVSTQTEFLKHISTSGLSKGKYTLIIDLTYPGQIDPASTEKIFSIGGGLQGFLAGLFGNIGFDAIIISAMIMALLVFFYLRSGRIESLKNTAPKTKVDEWRIRLGKESDVHEHIAQNLKVITMYNREIQSLMEINESLEKHGFVESAERNEKQLDENKESSKSSGKQKNTQHIDKDSDKHIKNQENQAHNQKSIHHNIQKNDLYNDKKNIQQSNQRNNMIKMYLQKK